MRNAATQRLANDQSGIEPQLNARANSDLPICACAFFKHDAEVVCATEDQLAGLCEGCKCGAASLRFTEHTVPARRLVWHPKEWSEYVPVISKGWASSSITLATGGCQILSFLLPGDVVSTASLFGAIAGRSVEAITEVSYRKYRRDDLKALLQSDPEFFCLVTAAWIREREQADNMLVDLGRRMADARIARLILYLGEKLAKRNMISGETIPFPLRQRHIADATGLTTKHVTKTLTSFQRLGLIEIENRTLRIVDAAELRCTAAW